MSHPLREAVKYIVRIHLNQPYEPNYTKPFNGNILYKQTSVDKNFGKILNQDVACLCAIFLRKRNLRLNNVACHL